jgi:hypothetical protein
MELLPPTTNKKPNEFVYVVILESDKQSIAAESRSIDVKSFITVIINVTSLLTTVTGDAVAIDVFDGLIRASVFDT